MGQQVPTPMSAKMELLWKNSSSGSFASQTVPLDLAGYDFVQVRFKSGMGCSPFLPIDGTTTATVSSAAKGDSVLLRSRSVQASETGVWFSQEYSLHTGSAENTMVVPDTIYGIKL